MHLVCGRKVQLDECRLRQQLPQPRVGVAFDVSVGVVEGGGRGRLDELARFFEGARLEGDGELFVGGLRGRRAVI